MSLKGGTWGYTSCDFEYTDESFEESFESPNDILTNPSLTLNCSGDAQCLTGTVSKIIDGDTIKVDGQAIRFVLASAPELKGYGGTDSRDFIETLCPVGSSVIIDEDDSQILGSYGRIIAKITCNDVILNSELLDANLGFLELRFCDSSEFRNEEWAQKHGCETNQSSSSSSSSTKMDCDSSYPDFCIPPTPPDLDCVDIPQKRFTVLQPDPHRFDGNKDGIGCES